MQAIWGNGFGTQAMTSRIIWVVAWVQGDLDRNAHDQHFKLDIQVSTQRRPILLAHRSEDGFVKLTTSSGQNTLPFSIAIRPAVPYSRCQIVRYIGVRFGLPRMRAASQDDGGRRRPDNSGDSIRADRIARGRRGSARAVLSGERRARSRRPSGGIGAALWLSRRAALLTQR